MKTNKPPTSGSHRVEMPLRETNLDLDLFFLGPKSEQRQFLLEATQLVLSDHIFWRRNYYPKDPPPIPYPKVEGADAKRYREAFFTELFSLISDLKLDVPIFSPRYMAHMISETTLPSLVAYLATLLYNPNNVTSEASGVTIRYELEIGDQFADLFGFPVEKSFGHLASGGTIANYESVWFTSAGRYLPVSLALARQGAGMPVESFSPDELWRLLNQPLDVVEELLVTFLREASETPESSLELLNPYLRSHLGDGAFQRLLEKEFGAGWNDPVIVLPSTAHYSWSKAASLLGIGKYNLLPVRIDSDFKITPDDYRRVLEKCLEERRPIIQSVVVAGSTEFGSVDPVAEIVEIRDEMQELGLYSPIHVDAAYGGYFATMFKSGKRHLLDDEDVHNGDNPWIPDAFRAIGDCDSVTVDPHKAGYIPYGSGGIILKHGYLKDIVAETAAYCLDSNDMSSREDSIQQLGKFILEGSKPGAAAASTWFSHRLIPLNLDGYGRQLGILCRIAQRFDRTVREAEAKSHGKVRLISILRPHTNIICLLALPEDANSISEVNELNKALAARFGVKNVISIQSYDYLVSHTTVPCDFAYIREEERLSGLEMDESQLDVMRLVFMNRWVEERVFGGATYLEDFSARLRREAAHLWEGLRAIKGR